VVPGSTLEGGSWRLGEGSRVQGSKFRVGFRLDMQIREARLADMPFLIDFQLKLALETENVQLDIGELTRGVTALLKDPSKGIYYVAEEGNDVIGCLSTTYEWSDWRCGTVLWIQSVYVSDQHRGKGVYKKLYEHIRSLVQKDPDLLGIRLYVERNNAPAKAVYSKLGMDGEHYGVFEWMKP
jgi:GNAT superfamily N-acetyltransferase